MTEMPRRLQLRLLTQGDPRQLTGGYLYQQRMAVAAPAHGADLAFVSVRKRPLPLQIMEVPQRLRRTEPCDAVLVDSIVAAAAAPWLAALHRRAPVIAVIHQQPGGAGKASIRSAVQKRLDLRLYHRADAVIAVSEWLAGELASQGVPSKKVVSIPPGRDAIAPGLSHSQANLRQGRQAALVCVSNWLRNKSIHLALEALSGLQPNLATLHLIGDTQADPLYARELRRRIAQTGLGDRVVVHGPLPHGEVCDVLSRADLLVHPSRHEAYGAVVAEAMTAGLPVVAYRIDNLPYLVRHGVDGFLLPYGDEPALAAAIALLVTDAQRRRQMGSAAKARALTWPTWADSAERFFRVVRRVADDYRAMRR